MRLCFSTLGCANLKLDEILTLANRYRITALELRGVGGELDHRKIPDFSASQLPKTKQLLEENGVGVLGVNTSCRFHDPKKYDELIEEAKTAIDLADKLGAKFIRVFGDKITNDSAAAIIRGLQILCDYAQDTHVRVLLEVHGDYNTIQALAPIAEACKTNAHFGLLWDVGHTHPTYGQNWLQFYNAFRSHIYHVHIKDTRTGTLCLPGEGNIPLTAIIKHLSDDGYEGYFSLEWEKLWHPDLPEIEIALHEFLKILPAQKDTYADHA